MLRSIYSCQNRVSADQYHLTISLAQVSLPLTLRVFWRYPVISYKFSIDRKLKYKWISLPCYNFIVWSKLQIYWRELRSFLESELRLWEGRCSISGVYYQGPNIHESALNCPMYCSNYYPIKHRVFPEETMFSKVWTRDFSLRIGADPFFFSLHFSFSVWNFHLPPMAFQRLWNWSSYLHCYWRSSPLCIPQIFQC